MKHICDSCEKYPCTADEKKLMLSCPAYSPKQKPLTNYDRIRAMTDEELAEWIAEYTDCLCGIHKPGCSKTKGTCVATWLDWLKQEVSTNG